MRKLQSRRVWNFSEVHSAKSKIRLHPLVDTILTARGPVSPEQCTGAPGARHSAVHSEAAGVISLEFRLSTRAWIGISVNED